MSPRLFCRRIGFLMLSADKGGGSGSAKKTDLEQLQEAREQISALEKEKQDLTAAASKHDSEKQAITDRAEAAEKKVKDLEAQNTTLTTQLNESKAEVTKLQGEAKDADRRGREIAAANGTEGTRKGEDATKGGADKDGKALADKYESLMKAGNYREASAFYAKNEKALDEYMASADRRRSEED